MDSKIGRFLQVDPHAGNYDNLSQYQYCLNNPLVYVDPDGKDLIPLNDDDAVFGYGHGAVLIGNDNDGWSLFSFNKDDSKEEIHFDTLEDFLSSDNENVTRYDKAIKYTCSRKADKILKDHARDKMKRSYSLHYYDCEDFVYDLLKKFNEVAKNKIKLPNIQDVRRNYPWPHTSPVLLFDFLKKHMNLTPDTEYYELNPKEKKLPQFVPPPDVNKADPLKKINPQIQNTPLPYSH